MNKTHVCIIGAGVHARTNIYPVLSLLREVTVDAVCTKHIENAEKALRRIGSDGRAYDDIERMLAAESCRNVLVIMQAKDACEAVMKCVCAGKRVFCEKPLGMNYDQAEEIRRVASVTGSDVMVGFMKEYAPAYRLIRDAIAAETYSKPLSYRGTFNVDASAFCASDRDFFYFVAIHYIALIRSLFGMPEVIHAAASNIGTGNSYDVLLRHGNGVTGSLHFENRSAWTREFEELSVTFENGYMNTADLKALRIHQSGDRADPFLSERDQLLYPTEDPISGMSRDLILRGFFRELEFFLEGGSPALIENTEVNQILDDILRRF